jgi:hypothetical protein
LTRRCRVRLRPSRPGDLSQGSNCSTT